MVSNQLSETFSALGDPIRRALIARLEKGPATVGELARPFPVSRPAVSKHLRVLERAGLVRRTTLGRTTRCELNAARLRTAAEWLESYRRFWERQLEQLGTYLEGQTEE